MTAYYNEFEPHAADWLENLIAEGLIAPGVVDRRDIRDVRPSELVGFRQWHLFAGIGGWSYALRLAGFPDDREVFTFSCPCQPFSAAGKGEGFADERHLWPSVLHIIRALRPLLAYGEQVASKDGLTWVDLVQTDLEGEDYAFRSFDLCAAGIGSPNIRQRQWLVGERLADSRGSRLEGCDQGEVGRQREAIERGGGVVGMADGAREFDERVRNERSGGRSEHTDGRGPCRLADDTESGRQSRGRFGDTSDGRDPSWIQPGRLRDVGRLADLHRLGSTGQCRSGETGTPEHRAVGGLEDCASERPQGVGGHVHDQSGSSGFLSAGNSAVERLADTDGRNASAERQQRRGEQRQQQGDSLPRDVDDGGRPGPVNGIWRDADWLFCRDAKWRPVESSTFPLVDGISFRVGSGGPFEGKDRAGMLKGYGNAINPWVAAEFIAAHQWASSHRDPVDDNPFADLL